MKKNYLPKPITILILTLLTAFVWVGLNIYRTLTVKPVTPVPENISKPINPVLNTSVLQKIEAAIFIPDSEVPPINVTRGGTTPPIPTATPTVIATPAASPSAIPESQP